MSDLPKVADMDIKELEEYIWYLTLPTARKIYDWEGCKPLLNPQKLIVGLVKDGTEVDYNLMKYVGEWDCFMLRGGEDDSGKGI